MSSVICRWSFRLAALFTPLLIMGCHDNGSSSTSDILSIIGAVVDLVLGIISLST